MGYLIDKIAMKRERFKEEQQESFEELRRDIEQKSVDNAYERAQSALKLKVKYLIDGILVQESGLRLSQLFLSTYIVSNTDYRISSRKEEFGRCHERIFNANGACFKRFRGR